MPAERKDKARDETAGNASSGGIGLAADPGLGPSRSWKQEELRDLGGGPEFGTRPGHRDGPSVRGEDAARHLENRPCPDRRFFGRAGQSAPGGRVRPPGVNPLIAADPFTPEPHR